jgi:arylsulfatase A-like enzyme
MRFTDYYAENSCTAGRSTFITGQSPYRTGLSKVAIPGATVGLQARDITIAEALKPLGYATGQFGKNHLGDAERGFIIVPAQVVVAQWLESFKDFPIRQRPASFNLDEVMRKLSPTH